MFRYVAIIGLLALSHSAMGDNADVVDFSHSFDPACAGEGVTAENFLDNDDKGTYFRCWLEKHRPDLQNEITEEQISEISNECTKDPNEDLRQVMDCVLDRLYRYEIFNVFQIIKNVRFPIDNDDSNEGDDDLNAEDDD